MAMKGVEIISGTVEDDEMRENDQDEKESKSSRGVADDQAIIATPEIQQVIQESTLQENDKHSPIVKPHGLRVKGRQDTQVPQVPQAQAPMTPAQVQNQTQAPPVTPSRPLIRFTPRFYLPTLSSPITPTHVPSTMSFPPAIPGTSNLVPNLSSSPLTPCRNLMKDVVLGPHIAQSPNELASPRPLVQLSQHYQVGRYTQANSECQPDTPDTPRTPRTPRWSDSLSSPLATPDLHHAKRQCLIHIEIGRR
jgi:hypothetical protein